MDADRLSGSGPSSSFEEIEIRLADRTNIRAVCVEPTGTPSASLVLAHAMFARKSSYRRLSLALAGRGFRTIAFDFRDHGDTKADPDWGYDDLVEKDLPAVVECTRARADGHPVIVVGHSLGAHVAIAAQGTGKMDADAIVMLAGNVWLRELEPRLDRWLAKVAIARGMVATAERLGRFPARRMRIGSDDASARFLRDLFRGVTDDAWRSDDGTSYLAAAANVRVPVAAVLGKRDRIMCHPDSGRAFARRVGGPMQIFEADTGHMKLLDVTDVVVDALAWVAQARP